MAEKSLVENEGVNAGSAEQQLKDQRISSTSPDQVRTGGRPEDIPSGVDDLDPTGAGDDDVLGAPAGSAGHPDESAGQDDGSIR